MNITLTPEQLAVLHASSGGPLEVVDELGQQKFVLISEPAYLHLHGLAQSTEDWCHARLKSLIQEGIESPEVSFEDAFARLRTAAESLSRAK